MPSRKETPPSSGFAAFGDAMRNAFRAGSTDKTLKLNEGHAHGLLNDLDREEVIADIRDWLLARIPAK
jgi:alpha-beta hydrolase superfamily lysophospholipase